MSTLLPAILRVMRPSCGRRFSAMLSAAMIFTRAMIGRHELLTGALRHVELAVDAVADDDVALLRLDVDIARALAHRLGEEAVDPGDDGRVVVGVDDVDELVLLVGVIALEAAAVVLVLLPDAVDRTQHHLAAGHRDLHRLAEERARVVDGDGVGTGRRPRRRPAPRPRRWG